LDNLNKHIQEALKGKQSAYNYLLNTFWDDVYRFQKSRLNNQNDAEDITIQTFAKAFDYLDQYNPKYDFKKWLLMMSKQVYIDYQRKKKHQFVDIQENNDMFQLPDKELTAEDRMILEQKLLQLKQAINQLKPHYKEVIELRYFHDLSYKEIAEKMGEPLNNIKVKLMRAKKLLADILNKNLTD
jgi:RNA polymerase sigma factor (sigma-70 family)